MKSREKTEEESERERRVIVLGDSGEINQSTQYKSVHLYLADDLVNRPFEKGRAAETYFDLLLRDN